MFKFTNSKGSDYYLHSRKAKTSDKFLYFFSKTVKEGVLESLPAGYTIVEMKSGLPVLKKA